MGGPIESGLLIFASGISSGLNSHDVRANKKRGSRATVLNQFSRDIFREACIRHIKSN